jgi:hypothetical protein
MKLLIVLIIFAPALVQADNYNCELEITDRTALNGCLHLCIDEEVGYERSNCMERCDSKFRLTTVSPKSNSVHARKQVSCKKAWKVFYSM